MLRLSIRRVVHWSEHIQSFPDTRMSWTMPDHPKTRTEPNPPKSWPRTILP
jgi:hypothetical protein